MTREEAIKVLENTPIAPTYGYSFNDISDALYMAADALLTDIVRCKDCKHKVITEDGEYDPEDIVCNYWMSDGLTEKDFCSYGERSE